MFWDLVISIQEDFVVPQFATTKTDPIRYGEVSTVNDLKIVDNNNEISTKIVWADTTIAINKVGEYLVAVRYNPDKELYDDFVTQIKFVVEKGVYTADDINIYEGQDEQYFSRISAPTHPKLCLSVHRFFAWVETNLTVLFPDKLGLKA